jgi:hypothetical protein
MDFISVFAHSFFRVSARTTYQAHPGFNLFSFFVLNQLSCGYMRCHTNSRSALPLFASSVGFGYLAYGRDAKLDCLLVKHRFTSSVHERMVGHAKAIRKDRSMDSSPAHGLAGFVPKRANRR